MSVFRIALIIIGTYFLWASWLRFVRREKGQTLFKLIASNIIWIPVVLFSVVPGLTHSLSIALGLGENLNTLIFIGFVILFIIIFKLISIIERIERSISEIVRNEALRDLSKSIVRPNINSENAVTDGNEPTKDSDQTI